MRILNIGDIVVTKHKLDVGMVYEFYQNNTPKVYARAYSSGALRPFGGYVEWYKIGNINDFFDNISKDHMDINYRWRTFSMNKNTKEIIYEVSKFYKGKDGKVNYKMELKDTIDLMCDGNYKMRFEAEYLQTKIRYEKLKKFCNEIEAAQMTNREEPLHDCPLELLREQQKYMGMYLSVLEKRAIIENIVL